MSNMTLAVVYAVRLFLCPHTPRQLAVVELNIAVRHGIVFG